MFSDIRQIAGDASGPRAAIERHSKDKTYRRAVLYMSYPTVHDKTQAGLNKTERAYPPAVQIVTQTMTYAEE